MQSVFDQSFFGGDDPFKTDFFSSFSGYDDYDNYDDYLVPEMIPVQGESADTQP